MGSPNPLPRRLGGVIPHDSTPVGPPHTSDTVVLTHTRTSPSTHTLPGPTLRLDQSHHRRPANLNSPGKTGGGNGERGDAGFYPVGEEWVKSRATKRRKGRKEGLDDLDPEGHRQESAQRKKYPQNTLTKKSEQEHVQEYKRVHEDRDPVSEREKRTSLEGSRSQGTGH